MSLNPCSIGFTLGEYFALPDEEQARIWDEASEFDWDELEEVEVSPDVLAFSYSNGSDSFTVTVNRQY